MQSYTISMGTGMQLNLTAKGTGFFLPDLVSIWQCL
jgi:hypothetical protein